MPADRPLRMTLEDDADVAGFRRAARQLLRDRVEPGDVEWHVAAARSTDLFGDDPHAEIGSVTHEAADSLAAPSSAAPSASPVGSVPSVPLATSATPVPPSASSQSTAAAPPVNVPAFFVPLCEQAALHADPGRFGLLYRLLWRLVHEPGLRGDALDPDRLQAEKMARMVRRDMHKMTAFVRFRPIGDGPSAPWMPSTAPAAPEPSAADLQLQAPADVLPVDALPVEALPDDSLDALPDDALLDDALLEQAAANALADAAAAADGRWHVAWFEPVHHIVAATAPFFARRFAQLKWAILTPERCVRWDGAHLEFGPGATRSEAPPADAGEQLWLTYYAHIFNPARLKLAAMQKEMPRRYWHNLPEAALIQPLTAAARQRTGQMVARGGSDSAHRRPAVSMALRIEQPPPARDTSPASADSSAPRSLAALAAAIQVCRECPIGGGATQAVPGTGPSVARLMMVGEQPGDQEDLRGAPFVGPAGQLLDRALAQLGWPRDAVYLTNAVKHFKYELRGKRRIHKSPSQREAAACLHWLEAEIDIVAPKALVALGATAARALLGRPVGVTAEHGRWLVREDGLKVLIALHPSALLRMEPGDREPAYTAWLQDLAHAASFVKPE